MSGLFAMQHDVDPKKELLGKLGDLEGFEIFGPQILVATYVRPKVTRGGIALPDSVRREDEYQGKVGLVIAMGPTAWKEDGKVDFGGKRCKVGDWIIYSINDGLPMKIKDVHCRLIDDVLVRGVVTRPDFLM